MTVRAECCAIVGSIDCTAPANTEDLLGTRGRCFSCGEAVCTAPYCSRVRRWGAYGRHRICASCDESQGAFADPDAYEAYLARLARLEV